LTLAEPAQPFQGLPDIETGRPAPRWGAAAAHTTRSEQSLPPTFARMDVDIPYTPPSARYPASRATLDRE